MNDRLCVANKVLATFSTSRIERRNNGWFVCWPSHNGEMSRRWQCRGQDFYPTWSHKYTGGGTACTALSQLIRWMRYQPVLPISTWRYWASEKCKLLPAAAAEELLSGGYPHHVKCVLCHETIEGSMDWWSLNGVSGPCCGWTSGCRQKVCP